MAFVFPEKETLHQVEVKFSPAYLPGAKKPYHLKTANQTELDLRQAAVKAKAYHLGVDTEAMINGFNAMMEAICLLVADGYKVRTEYFSVGIRIPGEYDGTETSLPQGVSPALRLKISRAFNEFIKDKVSILIGGKQAAAGFISKALDDATGAVNERATIGNLLTIRGVGLKIMAEGANQDQAGVFFQPLEGGEPEKCKVIAINERKTLKILIPPTLKAGKAYHIIVETWSAASRSGAIAKTKRSMRSNFTLLAQNPPK